MTDNDKTDAHEELLSGIFEHASPRPQPSNAARDATYAALHDEWQGMTTRRRRKRRVVSWSIAATVAIAAFLGFRALDVADAPDMEPVAAVVRVSGSSVAANNQSIDASTQIGSPLSLAPGDSLVTGDNSRVAMSWSVGGSLRMDQNSHIEIVSSEIVRLVEGAVYFDSRQFGEAVNPDLKLSIETPYGRVSHFGTQFLLQMQSGSLAISVREGEVQVVGPKIDVAVHSGQEGILSADRDFDNGQVSATHERWIWATEIAPEVQLDGRTVHEILAWVGRESGRSVSYRGNAEKSAKGEVIHGVGSQSPAKTMSLFTVISDLTASVESNVIIIE